MKKSVDDSPSDSILIVAAEASSCMYARRFIEAWKKNDPNCRFYGVGDRSMQDQGVDCLGFAEDMAVVGLQEVISHWSLISGCFKSIIERAQSDKPRFALLLDYPGFNLRLAKKLKAMGIPVVYYISPQLWAWKKGRVTQVRDYVDDMMVVFPFEVDFYKQYGITAHFVGHPLVEVIEDEKNITEREHQSQAVLGLMPGSRNSEINHNLATQIETSKILQKNLSLQVKLLVAPTLDINKIQKTSRALGFEGQCVQHSPTEMIEQCDFILTASGTATLQVALCYRPMVVMYRMNAITAALAKLLVRSVDSFCIVNLIAGRKVVPEFFQEQANPQALAASLRQLIENKNKREEMLSDLREVSSKLGKGGATQNLVNHLLEKYGVS